MFKAEQLPLQGSDETRRNDTGNAAESFETLPDRYRQSIITLSLRAQILVQNEVSCFDRIEFEMKF